MRGLTPDTSGLKTLSFEFSQYAELPSTTGVGGKIRRHADPRHAGAPQTGRKTWPSVPKKPEPPAATSP